MSTAAAGFYAAPPMTATPRDAFPPRRLGQILVERREVEPLTQRQLEIGGIVHREAIPPGEGHKGQLSGSGVVMMENAANSTRNRDMLSSVAFPRR